MAAVPSLLFTSRGPFTASRRSSSSFDYSLFSFPFSFSLTSGPSSPIPPLLRHITSHALHTFFSALQRNESGYIDYSDLLSYISRHQLDFPLDMIQQIWEEALAHSCLSKGLRDGELTSLDERDLHYIVGLRKRIAPKYVAGNPLSPSAAGRGRSSTSHQHWTVESEPVNHEASWNRWVPRSKYRLFWLELLIHTVPQPFEPIPMRVWSEIQQRKRGKLGHQNVYKKEFNNIDARLQTARSPVVSQSQSHSPSVSFRPSLSVTIPDTSNVNPIFVRPIRVDLESPFLLNSSRKKIEQFFQAQQNGAQNYTQIQPQPPKSARGSDTDAADAGGDLDTRNGERNLQESKDSKDDAPNPAAAAALSAVSSIESLHSPRLKTITFHMQHQFLAQLHSQEKRIPYPHPPTHVQASEQLQSQFHRPEDWNSYMSDSGNGIGSNSLGYSNHYNTVAAGAAMNYSDANPLVTDPSTIHAATYCHPGFSTDRGRDRDRVVPPPLLFPHSAHVNAHSQILTSLSHRSIYRPARTASDTARLAHPNDSAPATARPVSSRPSSRSLSSTLPIFPLTSNYPVPYRPAPPSGHANLASTPEFRIQRTRSDAKRVEQSLRAAEQHWYNQLQSKTKQEIKKLESQTFY